MKHELPTLSYEHDALEPYIDGQTMEIHHTKHHQAYIDKLNKALEGRDEIAEKSVEELLSDLENVPADIRETVRNNGGGHYNHSHFWRVMSPNGGGEPEGELKDAIDKEFGSFKDFQEKFSEAAKSQFGSGWAWLALGEDEKLHIHGMPNQDNPLHHGHKPLLGLDVWEHAYYLKYQNMRPSYIEAWWNIVNWPAVARNFEEALEENGK